MTDALPNVTPMLTGDRPASATCGDVSDIIACISRDWRQTAALGGVRLHTASRHDQAEAQVRGQRSWGEERALRDSNPRPSD